MICLKFDEVGERLKPGAKIILSKLKYNCDAEIEVKRSDRLCIYGEGKTGRIEYITDASFFRMLVLYVKHYQESQVFFYEEKPNFDACGPWLDMSRNGVLKVEKVKEYIAYTAMMGLNTCILYLEDTYELEGYPYFGYMRGRYTKEELKEIDRYAALFGIEVFPAIQTLGHLERYLHWDESIEVRDTFHCLLAEEERTYLLIEAMIKNMSECFASRKLHIGMDEAHDFGLGQYLKRNGYQDRTLIMMRHLNRISEIAKKYGLSLIMHGDMFFRLASKTDSYYGADDINIDQSLKTIIPDNVTIMYWRYNAEKQEEYDSMIEAHQKLSDRVCYAGGIASYFGFTCDVYNTYRIMQVALNSCKKNHIKEVYATIWMDDGAECDFFMTLSSLQLFAENMYRDSDLQRKAKENFEFITGASFDAFMDMSQFHNIFDGRDYGEYWFRYYGKRAVYQDVLSGLCEDRFEKDCMSEHYKYYAEKAKRYIDAESIWNDYYVYGAAILEATALKCEIAEGLQTAYLENDRGYLEALCEYKLEALYKAFDIFKQVRMDMWYKNNKAFGGEVLDARLNGVLGRIQTAKKRIAQYLNGEIDRIEELEAERLPFASYCSKDYAKISSAGIV